MRNYFLLTFFVLMAIFAKGQDVNVYALGFEEIGSHKGISEEMLFGNEFFLRMNPYRGTEDVLAKFEGVQVAYTGSSTLQQTKNEFTFWGKETGNDATKRISIDAASGEIIGNNNSNITPVDVQYSLRTNKVFGLKHGDKAKDLELVQIKQNDLTPIKGLEGIKAVSVGNATFDSNREFYIFTGIDDSYQEHLYTVNTSNGQIVNNNRVRGFYYNELEYDVQDDKLYGLCRKKTNSAQFFFVEISTLTAKPTIIRPVPKLFDVMVGTSAIDQKHGTYIFIGQDNKDNRYLYVLDLISGDIVSKNPITKKITELHCDNRAFATEFYGEKAADLTENNNSVEAAAIKSVDDYFTVEANLENVEGAKATVVNLVGEVIFTKILETGSAETTNIDLTQLEAGIYFMKIKADDKLYTTKFMKR